MDGFKDSNGLKNSDYRCRVGKIFADALLHDRFSLWYDHAETLCTHLGHSTVASLKTDHEHFLHVARIMDAHLSMIVTWIRKSLPTTVNLYSATAPICDRAKAHTSSELPLPGLCHLLLIYRMFEKQTATSLLGLEDEFSKVLTYGNGSFLNDL